MTERSVIGPARARRHLIPLELLRALSQGLGAAHGAGVVHRDVKDANIPSLLAFAGGSADVPGEEAGEDMGRHRL